MEDNQARKRSNITAHRLAKIVSPHTAWHCCLPPAQCRKGEMATAPAPAGLYSPVVLTTVTAPF